MDNIDKIDFAVSSFVVLEKQLLDCMEYIPFIDANKDAISPKFIPIITDACSLIDSIFFEFSHVPSNERFSLKKFSEIHEPQLSLEENVSLLLTLPVKLLQPYKAWTKEQPTWWNAYNSLKHDRLNNFHFATFSNAIQSLAGLHQLMARQRDFIGGFLKADWLDTTDEKVVEDIGLAPHVGSMVDVVVESRLFASATVDNFVNLKSSDEFYFDVDYKAHGLSNRVRNMLSAHDNW